MNKNIDRTAVIYSLSSKRNIDDLHFENVGYELFTLIYE